MHGHRNWRIWGPIGLWLLALLPALPFEMRLKRRTARSKLQARAGGSKRGSADHWQLPRSDFFAGLNRKLQGQHLLPGVGGKPSPGLQASRDSQGRLASITDQSSIDNNGVTTRVAHFHEESAF